MPETVLQKISPHVHWMTPGPPDRPSLAAVVGNDRTMLLDAAASVAHAGLFLDALRSAGVPAASLVALTHWHWDHIFGAVEIGLPLIAHRKTSAEMAVQAGYAWDDAALDARVAAGLEIPFCADNIKLELPEPRDIQIMKPAVLFDNQLEIQLGGVTCHIQHVGGDHAADSCVIFIEPDNVLFLGDCLYEAIYTPERHYKTANLFPVLDKVMAFDAEWYIEGHTDTLMSRDDMLQMVGRMREAGRIVDEVGPDDALNVAQTRLGTPLHEETADFLRAFIAGHRLAN